MFILLRLCRVLVRFPRTRLTIGDALFFAWIQEQKQRLESQGNAHEVRVATLDHPAISGRTEVLDISTGVFMKSRHGYLTRYPRHRIKIQNGCARLLCEPT